MAQTNLGMMYETGRGVPQDFAEAVKWYKLAAANGDAAGQNNLGAALFAGRGTSKDVVKAYMWIMLAAELGDSYARNQAHDVMSVMTGEQIAQGKKLAKKCKATKYKECE